MTTHEAHVGAWNLHNGRGPDWARALNEEYAMARRGETRTAEDDALLWQRIKLAREGAAVERCHVWPHLQRYSVGHHSHDVVSLVILCWQAAHGGALPRVELIAAAHFHDTPERVVGDVPRPVKDLLGVVLDNTEREVWAWLGIPAPTKSWLTDEELSYLEAADCVELMIWANEECARGNTTFIDWALNSLRDGGRYERLPPPFRAVVDALEQPGAVARMDFKQLKEIAGL